MLLLIEDSDLRDLGFVRGHVVKLRKRLREYAEHAAPPPLAPARPAPERPFAPQRHLRAAVGTPSLADIFSQRRVSLVENSWEQVRALGMPTVGGILCRHTLELVPEAKVLFPLDVRRRYREWTAEEGEEDEEVEVLESAAVRQLFGRIITAVGSAVAGIHDMVQLMPMLTKLGASGGGIRALDDQSPLAPRRCASGMRPSTHEALVSTLSGHQFTPNRRAGHRIARALSLSPRSLSHPLPCCSPLDGLHLAHLRKGVIALPSLLVGFASVKCWRLKHDDSASRVRFGSVWRPPPVLDSPGHTPRQRGKARTA